MVKYVLLPLKKKISDDEVMRDMLAHVVHEFICSCHVVHKICLKVEQKADQRKILHSYGCFD